MRQYRFLQYDVFTDAPFGGNQLAVLLDATGLTDNEMQQIAREMNYSETTFVLPATEVKALRKVRIFTPGTELPFAGHPTIGTMFALAFDKVVRSGDATPVYLELGIGLVPLDLLFEGDQLSFVWMHQPTPELAPWQGNGERLVSALGLAKDDLAPDLPIERGSSGVPFIYVPLRSLAALERAAPSGPALAALVQDSPPPVGVYLFSAEAEDGKDTTRRSRMFAPQVGITEDAATGAAAGPFAAYLLKHGLVVADRDGDARIAIGQGVEMGRPSLLKVAVSHHDGRELDIRVGGEAVLVAEGSILLP